MRQTTTSVNSNLDANFLRQAVKDLDAIRTYILASHPNAKFELLWPLDVNDPATRQLNRYINLPVEWETKTGSGLDTFLIEGFQFTGIDRNLDKVRRMAGYPFEVLSCPRGDCRYLMGPFNAGWPWERDYMAGRRSRVPVVKIWAYDHLCLFRPRRASSESGTGLPLLTDRPFPKVPSEAREMLLLYGDAQTEADFFHESLQTRGFASRLFRQANLLAKSFHPRIAAKEG